MNVQNRTAPRRSDTRERILWTAQDLFYRYGIRATGVDMIIAGANVTKVTFYRRFPSKDALVLAYLDYRHSLWMPWFADALIRARDAQTPETRDRAPLAPIVAAMREWFAEPTFRGCGFINLIAEFGDAFPGALAKCVAHKDETQAAIESLLAPAPDARAMAEATSIAMDGAIVRAQRGPEHREAALAGLEALLTALTAAFAPAAG
ncbi:MAG: TetR/AcrR family transcriptional regulator [Rhodoblastus sp.]|nr:TetR/AcrR family transcriptional regulator [Rhodoblastus sp.]